MQLLKQPSSLGCKNHSAWFEHSQLWLIVIYAKRVLSSESDLFVSRETIRESEIFVKEMLVLVSRGVHS